MKSPFVHLRSQAPDRPQEGIISGPVAFFLLPGTASTRRWPGTDREEATLTSVLFLLFDPEPLWHESAPRGASLISAVNSMLLWSQKETKLFAFLFLWVLLFLKRVVLTNLVLLISCAQ